MKPMLSARVLCFAPKGTRPPDVFYEDLEQNFHEISHNMGEWPEAELGACVAEWIRADALVDTGAVKFYLKASVIKQLGLRPVGEIKSRTMSARSETRTVFSPVSLQIQGRTGRFDVVEVPDSLPNIVGQIPLEDLDRVVDGRNQKLIPNPEHKHGELSDEFWVMQRSRSIRNFTTAVRNQTLNTPARARQSGAACKPGSR
jgi:predicted aspartyl protease